MKETKRQDLPQGLWIVATPIGNLADMTPRGKLALEEADLILCEDTRKGAVLLSALGVPLGGRSLERMDAHTPTEKMGKWVGFLEEGRNIALVSDAGTPGISDPGAKLVGLAAKA